MCLGQLARCVGIDADGTLRVRAGEALASVSPLALAGEVAVGDWLVVHSGFALERVSADEAREALLIRSAADPPYSRPEVRP